MTNAEKYLKDNVSVEELADKLTKKIQSTEKYGFYDNFVNDILIKFFKAKDIPTLTEDERVILKNLRYEKGAYEYTKIGRTDLDSEGNCDLILIDSDDESVWWGEYGHLFQFIKERRRIRDKGVVRRWGIMSYDITFCTNKKCKNKKCERHPIKLKGWYYPVSMSDFTKCKFWKNGEEYNIQELLGE